LEWFQRLSYQDRSRILDRLKLLETFPEMYKVVETGRWRGLRRFFSGSQVVFYAYWPGEDTVYVEVVAAARRPQTE
jgi:mRNA-degrading endonuclease RelE of RelBE toxin-antitoxin system